MQVRNIGILAPVEAGTTTLTGRVLLRTDQVGILYGGGRLAHVTLDVVLGFAFSSMATGGRVPVAHREVAVVGPRAKLTTGPPIRRTRRNWPTGRRAGWDRGRYSWRARWSGSSRGRR